MRSGNDDHKVRSHPPRPVRPRNLPVRKIRGFHQHRLAYPVYRERDAVVCAVYVRHPHRRQLLARKVLLASRHSRPVLGPRCRRENRMVIAVVKGGRVRQPVFLAVADAVPDNWFVFQRSDQLGVLHQKYRPRPRRCYLCEIRMGAGFLSCSVRPVRLCGGHVIAHPHKLHMLYPSRYVQGAVDIRIAVFAGSHGSARAFRQLRLVQEVIRHRSRGFEIKPFHGINAPVAPIRQQHWRHRRAVGIQNFLVVFPHSPAAAVAFADILHSAQHLRVFAVSASAFIAREVVGRPVRHHIEGVLIVLVRELIDIPVPPWDRRTEGIILLVFFVRQAVFV